MNTVQIKQKIHDYIDHADERFLRLVFSMVESEEAENELFSAPNEEMIKRAKESLKSIEKGNTHNIHAFKKDIDSWKKNRSTQLR